MKTTKPLSLPRLQPTCVEAQVNSAVARREKCLSMRGRTVTMETRGNHVINNLASTWQKYTSRVGKGR